MKLREADCCHSCKHFLCEKWECFGDCKLHPFFEGPDPLLKGEGVYFHTICDDLEKRSGDMAFKEQE
jgi:hypothetical protein